MRLHANWRRRWDWLRAAPFLDPDRAILPVATTSGILLALGAGLVLTLFDGGVRHSFAARHLAGILFLVSSVCASILAWHLQRWDLEIQRKDDGARMSRDVRLINFRSHGPLARSLWAWTFLSFAFTTTAMAVLWIGSPPEQSTWGEQKTPHLVHCRRS
jgi:hypothetical protein